MIELPTLLPEELLFLRSLLSEGDLTKQLLPRPAALTLFIRTALFDDKWTALHSSVVEELLRSVTQQLAQGRLPLHLAKKTAAAIQAHSATAIPLLVTDSSFLLPDGSSLPFNTLLFQCASPLYFEMVSSKRVATSTPIALSTLSYDQLKILLKYIETGRLTDLWKEEKPTLINLAQFADEWKIEGMLELCEEGLARYLTPETAVESLLFSRQKQWRRLKKASLDFLNKLEIGLTLADHPSGRYSLELSKESAVLGDYLNPLLPHLSELRFRGDATHPSNLTTALAKFPNITSLGISERETPWREWREIPKSIRALDLEKNPWLQPSDLQELAELVPELQELNLSNNSQLGRPAWEELLGFKKLQSLILRSHTHLTDAELDLIHTAVPHLIHLDTTGCKALTR